MSFLQNLREQLLGIWEEMSTGRKIFTAALVLLLVAGIGVTGYWAASTEYRVLFSQLSPGDAGNITNALRGQGIEYKLEDGGTTVLVQEDQISKARIDLAVQGLPATSGKGWEILEESSMGRTPRQQEQLYKLALEGELARSIMTLEPVAFARVHLVIPKKRLIEDKQKKAKGTAIIRLKAGRALDRQATQGIQHLISGAVEGLEPKRVALLDSSGAPLPGISDDGLGGIGEKMEYKKAYEKHLAEKAQNFLNEALGGGVGRAIVQVNTKMDYTPGGTSSIVYDPEAIAQKMEIVRDYKKSQRDRSPVGVAGTGGNLPNNGVRQAAGSEVGNSDEGYRQAEYHVSRVMKWDEREVGTLKQVSVAAVVDLTPQKDKDGKPTGKSLTLAQVESLIRETTGLDAKLDTLTVVEGKLNVVKDLLPSEEQISEVEAWRSTLSLIRSGAIGLLSLVMLILGVMLIRGIRKRKAKEAEAEDPGSPELRIAQRVSALAETNPEILGQVLSTWLEQPEDKEAVVANAG